MKKIFFFIILTTLFIGCTSNEPTELTPINKTITCSKPYILYSGSCCLDLNDNTQCDYLETTQETTTTTESTTKPNQTTQTTTETTTTTTTPCDRLINETTTKPAARTTKLCLSTKEKTRYGNITYSLEDIEGIISVTAYIDNKTSTATLIPGEDIATGNTVMRLIGTAKHNTVTYAQVYVWTIEGEIECTVNSDCGETQYLDETCIENRLIVKQYISYRCINPGTIFSKCVAQQKAETIKVCGEAETCITGDNICIPKECANNIRNGDEEGIDCGGTCRPCHCFDNKISGDEEGIDCGGSCRPCKQNELPQKDTTPPQIKIITPESKTYSKERIDLAFTTNEKTNCSYSINNLNYYIGERKNVSITASAGINQLTLYCVDAAGNNATAKQQFTVILKKSSVCPENNVSSDYREHPEEIIFYSDDEAILGTTNKCSKQTFEYALTYLRDSDEHIRKNNETDSMGDLNLSMIRDARISYECRNTGKLRAEYASITAEINPKTHTAKMLLYFTETKEVSIAGSYWRIYAYGEDVDTVDINKFIDVSYKPVNSTCGKEEKTLYQEIDLTPLIQTIGGSKTKMRLGFYTDKINSEITLKEIEIAKEAKETTKK